MTLLEAERPRAGSPAPQVPVPKSWGLTNGVKAPALPSFHSASDGDTAKNFVDALDTYFELAGMRDLVQKAHFVSVLLEGKAHTWFMVQDSSFDEDGDMLEWIKLHKMVLTKFCPANIEHVTRTKL